MVALNNIRHSKKRQICRLVTRVTSIDDEMEKDKHSELMRKCKLKLFSNSLDNGEKSSEETCRNNRKFLSLVSQKFIHDKVSRILIKVTTMN